MPNRLRPVAATTRLRARDVDRAAVRDALDSAFADGQLSDGEHRNRVEAAGSARTLADLDRLVRDLQVPAELRESVSPPSPQRSTRWAVALATAVVLVGGIVVVTSSRDSGDPAATTAGAQAELTTAAGFGRMLDEIAHHLDDSQVDRLTVHPAYATFSRPVPGQPGREQSYRYEVEDGRARITDDGTSSHRTEGVPVDLAELRPNVPQLIGLLYGADRTLGVGNPSDVYLIADRGDDGPAVGIYLRNEDTGAQGFLTVGFDGAVRSVHRSDR
ncbi:DUF1707 SHOCT-like domain-containing protein [Rhodococcus tukisamuensis]|uniref:DUF1707 domain-containing protein n=1 Tax=Rhodococcus tukisamuensis TaxID=168276 RepID=A0A1G6UG45_9NOCA|nr:DUF1707 domain-containing protein [Rhodococcus tukisamuensis]SDD40380.1 protein of unknown function [Rhodococcus tukisamuensis]